MESPLSQFQHRQFTKVDIRTLLLDINSKRNTPLDNLQFDLLFETLWPRIEEEYEKDVPAHSERESASARSRDDRALLEEILFRLRQLEERGSTIPAVVTIEELLNSPVTADFLSAYTEWKFPGKGISERWQAAILSDIRSQKYPIDSAVNRATPAVNEYAKKTPGLFPTGTDFITKSLGFVDLEFRKEHPFGDRTLRAFEDFGHLVRES